MGTSLGRFATLAILVGALPMAVAGCGGGGQSGAQAPSESTAVTAVKPHILSKAEFVKQGNVGCRKARSGLRSKVALYLRVHRSKEPSELMYAGLAHFVILPTVEAELQSLYYLGVPRGGAKRIHKVLFAEKRALDMMALQKRIASIGTIEKRFDQSAKLLRAFGLSACTNGRGSHRAASP